MISTALAILIPAAWVAYLFLCTGRRRAHLPPGPKTLPIIGNLHQLPKERAYLKFNEWAQEFGGIYSFMMGSKTSIVISDRRLVKELMDKRSSVTGNRPQSFIMQRMVYDDDDIILMQADDPHWKVARRLMHQNFSASAVMKNHVPLLECETTQMLRDMIQEPEDFMIHPRRFANSFMMSVAYGIRTPHNKVSHMVEINKVNASLTQLLAPGTLPPVDVFPFLFYLPHQLFGNWRDKVARTSRIMNDLYSHYLNLVVERRKTSGPMESVADKLVQEEKSMKWTWHGLYFTAGLMMEAGSDTTSGMINNFLLLMTRNPEAYKKAQQQIDAVVGSDRTPQWKDFAELPEVNKLVKETMRMRPISPFAFPHALAEDIWIDGMLLPKGSDIYVNVLGLHYDEKRFPNPHVFDPEHYAGKPELADVYANAADFEQRDHYAYGTGRRICVGIHLAERAVFLAIAKILWAFEILPKHDAAGKVIENDLSWETGTDGGVLVTPKPFHCDLVPRSDERKQTILREFKVAQTDTFPRYLVPEN